MLTFSPLPAEGCIFLETDTWTFPALDKVLDVTGSRRRRGRDGADLDHHPQEVGHRPPLHAPVRAEAQDRDAGDREGPTTRRDALERAGVGAREPEAPRQHV